MDLRTELLKEHSREQSEKIARWIGGKQEKFALLMDIFLLEKDPLGQRSAWVMSVVCEKHKHLTIPYIPQMVARMQEAGVHDAIKRNVVRVLQHMDIPEEEQGVVMNVCFDLLADTKEAIAIRCFSMTILTNMAKYHPDIRHEIIAIVEDAIEQGVSAGFKSRAAKTLKALTKL